MEKVQQDIEYQKLWLMEMMDIISAFHPDEKFSSYTYPDGTPIFDPESSDLLEKRLNEAKRIFEEQTAEPGSDIYAFCIAYNAQKEKQ